MSFFVRFSLGALAAAACVAVSGCLPAEQSQLDDEKEPHFVLGKNRVNVMDFPGAIEAFQEALDVNPRSAPAHYQLAWLYDSKVPDPAAAIYHYQRYLKLDPAARNPEVIRDHIESCRRQLASSDMTLPSSPGSLKQLEKLTEENRQLQQKADQLQQQVNQLQALVKQWSDYASQLAARAGAPPNNPPQPQPPPQGGAGRAAPPPVAAARTHTVAERETLVAIAHKHGVSLTALEAANPGVIPTKLRAGQVLNLPQ